MNTIRFISTKREITEKQSYRIPTEIVHFLNDSFYKDESIQILRYFIFYLHEFNINLLDWYDENELSLRLSLLENKSFKQNSTFDKLLNKKFEQLIERIDEFSFVKEFFFLFKETKSFKEYQPIFEKIISDLRELQNKNKKIKKKKDIWKKKKSKKQSKKEIDLIPEIEQEIPEGLSLYEKIKTKKEKKEIEIESFAMEHEWNGTAIRFRQPNGKWGKWVDLRPVENNTIHRGGGGGIGKRKVQAMIDATIANTTFTGSAAFGSGPIVDINESSANVGTSSLAARQDHKHFHGNLTGSELHNEATIFENGFLSSYDKIVLSLAPQTSTQTTIGDHIFVEYLDFI